MRFTILIFLLLSLTLTVLAWDKLDYELFELADGVQKYEGKDTNFYSWLGVFPTASSAEIGKAYRKKSLEMHPDKNPGVKDIEARFARLGVVAQILRSERRERYDHFHKNGFPRWRGTGYYYSRFRPGLATVVAFLVLLTSALQYLIHRINYKNDLARIDRFITSARRAAWGPKMNKIEGRRKVRVNMGAQASYEEDEDENTTGRTLDMVVEGDAVYILEPNGDLLPLDASAASAPSWRRTWPVVLASAVYSRVRKPKEAAEDALDANGNDSLEAESDSESKDTSRNASGRSTPSAFAGRQPQPAVKAGGRRRKPTRK